MKTQFIHSNALIISTALISGMLNAETTSYTTDADFNLGTSNGVIYGAPNSDQLQISTTSSTFPYLWVANSGDTSLSKVNTDGDGGDGCEEARYLTWWGNPEDFRNNGGFSGPAPSRTAVNIEGDVYIANRHFDGLAPDLIKVSANGGVDRNNDGIINTSSDKNGNCIIEPDEMLPVIDDGDGVLDIDDFMDERVIWVRQFGERSSLGRSVCLDNSGNIWAGTFNNPRAYYKFDPSGTLLAGPITTGSIPNYGCAVDADGILWGASLGSQLVKLNTNTDTFVGAYSGSGNYGITVGNNRVYLGSVLRSFNPTTNSFGPIVAFGGTGVAVDGDGAVWFGTPTLRKFVIDPSTGNLNPTPVCSVSTLGSRGPIVDKDGNIWTINLNNDSVSQYDKNCNFISKVPVGRSPYTYSDATGFGLRISNPTGIWDVIQDSGNADTVWDRISWNTEPEGNTPTDTNIVISARSANNQADLALLPYTPVSNNLSGIGLTGRYIQVQALLSSNSVGVTPVVSDINVTSESNISCDVNADGQVDILDIRLIGSYRNVPVSQGDPLYDINGDGFINADDGRKCTLECTNSRCATN